MATYEMLYVGGATTLTGDDSDLETTIGTFTDTWNITYIDDNTTPPTLPGSYDVVLISETVTSNNTNVSGTYMQADIPVMNAEALSWDEGSEDYVSAQGINVENDWEVIDATAAAHPIIDNLGWADASQHNMLASGSGTGFQGALKTNFGSGIVQLMQPVSPTTYCNCFAIETGATINTGTATNRRAGFGSRSTQYSNFSTDADALFESCLLWLVGALDGATSVPGMYNGATWDTGVAKRYNGATWDPVVLKRYSGTVWEG
jgi:hypothetical protein